MRQIETKIVADSISPKGHRITSMLLTYPRIIHSELMTHRMFSRNSASSRAIPFEKMVKMVEEDPFIPIAWQFNHKGMQGIEYVTEESDFGGIEARNESWLQARDFAIQQAKDLSSMDTTKQLCNRLLEPFMWTTELVSGTEWENFFELRCPKYKINNKLFRSKKDALYYKDSVDTTYKFTRPSNLEWLSINESQAEIHIQKIAEMMWDAMNESVPKTLQSEDWHIPFGDKISDGELRDYFYNVENNPDPSFTAYQEAKLKVSTARCARLSYMTFDGEIDYEKDIKLHDRLLSDGHMSPFEHCARVMNDEEYYSFIKGKVKTGYIDESEHQIFLSNKSNNWGDYPELGWCNNFQGFIPYRYLIEELYEN